jgi:predicted glycoside hydrolase/deacetylase ChbG (UPF0249 family)
MPPRSLLDAADNHGLKVMVGLLPHFRRMAKECGIPLRGFSGVRHCSRFYGQWAGESQPEQVNAANLIEILTTEVGDGVTELGCHPGYADHTLVSSYAIERELELEALCDGRVRRFLDGHGIKLVGFDGVPRMIRLTAGC